MTRDFVYIHQEYTKIAKLVKKDITLKTQKIAVNQAKFIFYRKSRFFQNWGVKMPNFICRLNNFSDVVPPPKAICSRWLTLWEIRVFHAKNSVIYLLWETHTNMLHYWTTKMLFFCMTNSNFSKSKPPTAYRFWGWNNLAKVVQFTDKVWHLHSSVLKKLSFSIKNEFGSI